MNAAEARKLSLQQLSGAVIEPYLEAIYGKIKHAAGCGRVSIVHPWFGLNAPDGSVQEAVSAIRRIQGNASRKSRSRQPCIKRIR